MNHNLTEFQIDTGAEASIISEGTHKKIGSLLLSQVTPMFKGPDQSILPILRRFTGRLRKDDVKVEQEIFCSQRSTQTPTRIARNRTSSTRKRHSYKAAGSSGAVP